MQQPLGAVVALLFSFGFPGCPSLECTERINGNDHHLIEISRLLLGV